MRRRPPAGDSIPWDDYLVKRFSMAELMTMTGSLLRRSGRFESAVRYANAPVLSKNAHRVLWCRQPIEANGTGEPLLSMLAQHPGDVPFKVRLLSHVWGSVHETNLVGVHAGALRRKLQAHGLRLAKAVRDPVLLLRA